MAEATPERRRGRPLKQAIQECEAKWFTETLAAATDGEPNQMALLGHMYSIGYGCPADSAEAQKWFDEANMRLGYNVLTEHPAPQQNHQQQQQVLQPGNQLELPPPQQQHRHHPPPSHQQQQQQQWDAGSRSSPQALLDQPQLQQQQPDGQELDQQKVARVPRMQAAVHTAPPAVLASPCPPAAAHLYKEAELHSLKQGQQQQA